MSRPTDLVQGTLDLLILMPGRAIAALTRNQNLWWGSVILGLTGIGLSLFAFMG